PTWSARNGGRVRGAMLPSSLEGRLQEANSPGWPVSVSRPAPTLGDCGTKNKPSTARCCRPASRGGVAGGSAAAGLGGLAAAASGRDLYDAACKVWRPAVRVV